MFYSANTSSCFGTVRLRVQYEVSGRLHSLQSEVHKAVIATKLVQFLRQDHQRKVRDEFLRDPHAVRLEVMLERGAARTLVRWWQHRFDLSMQLQYESD